SSLVQFAEAAQLVAEVVLGDGILWPAHRLGLDALAMLDQHRDERFANIDVGWIEPQGSPHFLLHFLRILVLLIQEPAQAEMRQAIFWLEADRQTIFRLRFIGLSLFLEDDAQIQMHRGTLRPQTVSGLEFRFRVVELATFDENLAEVIVSKPMVLVEFDGALEFGLRLGKFTLGKQARGASIIE